MKMSKMIFIISFIETAFLFIACTSAIAQEKKITEKDLPSSVITAFHKKYPKARIKGLSTEIEQGKKYYEIVSIDGITKRDLLFTKTGKIVEIEETISATELPKGSIKSIEKNFPKAEIARAEKVTIGSKITYELAIRSKENKYEVVLNKEGKIIKRDKVNGEEGDED